MELAKYSFQTYFLVNEDCSKMLHFNLDGDPETKHQLQCQKWTKNMIVLPFTANGKKLFHSKRLMYNWL